MWSADDETTERNTGLVAFITAQTGVDLVISFAICKPDDPAEIESLTFLRTPKYEALLGQNVAVMGPGNGAADRRSSHRA